MVTFENFLENEEKEEYFKKLRTFLDLEEKNYKIIPDSLYIYKAMNLTPFSNTKVIIVGDDPYPNSLHATGLAFSTNEGYIPRSLNNIFREYVDDLGFIYPKNGDLTKWANEGVLLMNRILTTRDKVSLAHKKKGWEIFTLNYIKLLNREKNNLVFILWGKNAYSLKDYIDANRHLVLVSSHPSPLSARISFFKSRPFSQANNYLKANGIGTIDWRLS
ncbi:MAG: uracil-DNA glycosylase [Acholeplasmatales bacterium]|jgi:uracil-DNA glycosylase|nr:uracil-DNA glycosylase [Acholeplasmatales bacterium]